MDCANCANKMEAAAQKTPGVKNATVNFMTLKMSVEFEEGQDHKAVMQQVYANCKKGGGRLRDLRHLTIFSPLWPLFLPQAAAPLRRPVCPARMHRPSGRGLLTVFAGASGLIFHTADPWKAVGFSTFSTGFFHRFCEKVQNLHGKALFIPLKNGGKTGGNCGETPHPPETMWKTHPTCP